MITDDPQKDRSKPKLEATPQQARNYHDMCSQKPYRKQMRILVVEDQIFSQRLLTQILSGKERYQGIRIPRIEVAEGVKDGWKCFLETAPDIASVDLCLVEGNGHTLTRAMKLLDPSCWVAIVSANSYEEELEIARQNHVDAFIAKPYSIKLIMNCVNRYLNTFKPQPKSAVIGE